VGLVLRYDVVVDGVGLVFPIQIQILMCRIRLSFNQLLVAVEGAGIALPVYLIEYTVLSSATVVGTPVLLNG